MRERRGRIETHRGEREGRKGRGRVRRKNTGEKVLETQTDREGSNLQIEKEKDG